MKGLFNIIETECSRLLPSSLSAKLDIFDSFKKKRISSTKEEPREKKQIK